MMERLEFSDNWQLCALGILLILEKNKCLSFSEIEKALKLRQNQAVTELILKFLREKHFIIPHTKPMKNGRIMIRYRLSHEGKALLDIIYAQIKNI